MYYGLVGYATAPCVDCHHEVSIMASLCLNLCSVSTRTTAPQLLLFLMAGAFKYPFFEIQLKQNLAPSAKSSAQSAKANQPLHTCGKALKEEGLVARLPVQAGPAVTPQPHASGLVGAIGCRGPAGSPQAPATASPKGLQVKSTEVSKMQGLQLILLLLFYK